MLIVVGVLGLLVLLAVLNTGQGPRCRWQKDPDTAVEGLTYWRCATCGGVERTAGHRVPNLCRDRRR